MREMLFHKILIHKPSSTSQTTVILQFTGRSYRAIAPARSPKRAGPIRLDDSHRSRDPRDPLPTAIEIPPSARVPNRCLHASLKAPSNDSRRNRSGGSHWT